jgi:hypothetical protein
MQPRAVGPTIRRIVIRPARPAEPAEAEMIRVVHGVVRRFARDPSEEHEP